MDKFEFKIEFDCELDNVFDIINDISYVLNKSKCTNTKAVFTLIDEEGGIEFCLAE